MSNGPGRLGRHAQEWDDLAASDALWAILSSPDKQHGGWDVEEFFATGRIEMERVIARAAALGYPAEHRLALDFGCGVGRVTRAMTESFDRAIGIDVSSVMIDGAQRLNDGIPGLEFIHNERPDLAVIDDVSVDLVYSYIVLQHLPSDEMIQGYVREFVRIVRPGGLVAFQLPDTIPLRNRLQPRPRAYALLRRAGVPSETLRHKLGLHPIRMRAMSEPAVKVLLEQAGATILASDPSTDDDGISNRMYWVTKQASWDPVAS
jgi:SAM-dependent methyltransferase